ncbi:hypothetical protein MKEN_01091300 [Mycena kentingensis (nom. inval.)]|nr:hypothetical protein MKEN_01091300 [Mycena kentingensis (nom. inval.)]
MALPLSSPSRPPLDHLASNHRHIDSAQEGVRSSPPSRVAPFSRVEKALAVACKLPPVLLGRGEINAFNSRAAHLASPADESTSAPDVAVFSPFVASLRDKLAKVDADLATVISEEEALKVETAEVDRANLQFHAERDALPKTSDLSEELARDGEAIKQAVAYNDFQVNVFYRKKALVESKLQLKLNGIRTRLELHHATRREQRAAMLKTVIKDDGGSNTNPSAAGAKDQQSVGVALNSMREGKDDTTASVGATTTTTVQLETKHDTGRVRPATTSSVSGVDVTVASTTTSTAGEPGAHADAHVGREPAVHGLGSGAIQLQDNSQPTRVAIDHQATRKALLDLKVLDSDAARLVPFEDIAARSTNKSWAPVVAPESEMSELFVAEGAFWRDEERKEGVLCVPIEGWNIQTGSWIARPHDHILYRPVLVWAPAANADLSDGGATEYGVVFAGIYRLQQLRDFHDPFKVPHDIPSTSIMRSMKIGHYAVIEELYPDRVPFAEYFGLTLLTWDESMDQRLNKGTPLGVNGATILPKRS